MPLRHIHPLFFTMAGLLVGGSLLAQSNAVSAGGNASSPSGNVSYTIGQPVANSIHTPGYSINEGVQQPYELFVVSIFTNDDQRVLIDVFPNPTSSYLTVRLHTEDFSQPVRYTLTDINGNRMSEQSISHPEWTIPMTEYPSGTYFLTVRQGGTLLQQFNIAKH